MTLRSWLDYARASQCLGGGRWAEGARLSEAILAREGNDPLASSLLAMFYEKLGRTQEALAAAEAAVLHVPDGLAFHQRVIQLALVLDDHDKVAHHIRCALALPAMVTGFSPGWTLSHRVMRCLSWVPGLRGCIGAEQVRAFEPGVQAAELAEWKSWAEEYLAWHEGRVDGGRGRVLH